MSSAISSPTTLRHWTLSNTLCAALVAGCLVSLYWVRVNIEPSVPYGLYRLHGVRGSLTRGTLVLLPVPRSVQQWHSAWLPLLKPIAAIAGERVCVEQDILMIGGEWYGRIYTEAGGMRLPHITGCLTVGAGEVFVASKGYRSLDSRYFGPVKIREITATATPLLVWR